MLHPHILVIDANDSLISIHLLFIYLFFSVTLFCEFLCDRLKDHYTIIPHALFGILALVCIFYLFICYAWLLGGT